MENAAKRTCQFSVNLEFTKAKDRINVRIFEGNKAKSFAAACFSIQHDRRIDDSTKLGEELSHGFRGNAAGESAYKQFCRALMLLPGDRSLRVDLR